MKIVAMEEGLRREGKGYVSRQYLCIVKYKNGCNAIF